jgi:hypothetical protein
LEIAHLHWRAGASVVGTLCAPPRNDMNGINKYLEIGFSQRNKLQQIA